MKTPPAPGMTLGCAVAAKVRLIVWNARRHQVEPHPVDMAQRYGVQTNVGQSAGPRYVTIRSLRYRDPS